jgi:predicted Zn-dependent protease with MMP-like domain
VTGRLHVSEDEFAAIVEAQLQTLPDWIVREIKARNVAIDIADERHGEPGTLGLYRTQSTPGGVTGAPPLREITLYRLPILRVAGSHSQVRRVVHDTLLHELGHLFGMSETDLDRYTIGNHPGPDAESVHPPR